MASRNATIAEAIKTALNTEAADPTAFGETFTATRVYVPAVPLEDLDELKVTVYAASDDVTRLTRGSDLSEITIQVGIQKRLPAHVDPTSESANTIIDPLVELAEKVAHFFQPGTYGGSAWSRKTLRLPDAGHLIEHRTFTALITLVFRID